MRRLLLPNKLSKYAPTISTYLIINFSKHKMARNIHNNSCLIRGENIMLKSILCICEKLYLTSFAL